MTPQIIAAGFPVPPTRGPEAQHATRYIFGAEVLVYIIAAANAEPPCEVYGLLSVQDMEDARYAGQLALVAKEIHPQAADTITEIMQQLGRILARLTAEPHTPTPAERVAIPPAEIGPAGGTKVPTNPRPQTQPPAPTMEREPAFPMKEWSF